MIEIKSPMPGKILEILVREGDMVFRDTPLLILESMKMHNEICSHCDGTIFRILTNAGDQVQTQEKLIEICL
jgi:glutaconyl-CoA/methylmalonyl-CoA decarboxylase subunit gamma